MLVTARSRRPLVAALGVAGIAAAALAAAVPAAAASSSTTIVAGGQPQWATKSADRGALSATTSVAGVRIYLAGRDPQALAAYAQAVSTPGSASYGKFLTPAQVQQRYGATAAQRSALTSWAASNHLTVTGSTNEYLAVSGSAKALGGAFHTALHHYRTPKGDLRAPNSAARIPTSLSSAVLAVSGLASATPDIKPNYQPAGDVPVGPKATCSAYYDQYATTGAPKQPGQEPYSQCPFIPSQLRTAYGVTSSGLTGKGATIAVVDAYGSSTMLADANRYSKDTGDKPFRSGQYTEYVTPDQWTQQAGCGGAAGWASEEALDVEMAHGLAPGAKVVYVGANSCFDTDFLDSFNMIVDKHLADIVTNSWGELIYSSADGASLTQGTIDEYESVFQRAATEGIGFQFSAGDCGDSSPGAAATGANCDPTTTQSQANYPDSDPMVTSVGGTWLATSSKKGTYGSELSMGNSRSVLSADGKSWTPYPGNFYFGSGGGTADIFPQPPYQKGIVPNKLANTLQTGQPAPSPRRVTPDIAIQGDISNATLVGISDGVPYSEDGYGGTSVSSPELAGVLADAIQANGGRALGFANPVLYERQSTYHDVLNGAKKYVVVNLGADPTTGAARVRLYSVGQDYGLTAGKGYDKATGLGSPSAKFLNSFRR